MRFSKITEMYYYYYYLGFSTLQGRIQEEAGDPAVPPSEMANFKMKQRIITHKIKKKITI